MHFQFPLSDVNIETTDHPKVVNKPLYDDGFFSVNQNEITVTVDGVAQYHTYNGSNILISPYEDAEPSTIEHFLNNWGLVSILHQRNVINFHSSSFCYEEHGIMVCGDSGVGKSSLTAAFSFSGAEFISDDITSVIFKEDKPVINVLPNQMALREETITQLGIQHKKTGYINPLSKKYLLSTTDLNIKNIPLTHIFWINIWDKNELEFYQLNGIDKFTMLRGEICGWDILKGMPETEADYMKQLIKICRNVEITKILRPRNLSLQKLAESVYEYLNIELN